MSNIAWCPPPDLICRNEKVVCVTSFIFVLAAWSYLSAYQDPLLQSFEIAIMKTITDTCTTTRTETIEVDVPWTFTITATRTEQVKHTNTLTVTTIVPITIYDITAQTVDTTVMATMYGYGYGRHSIGDASSTVEEEHSLDVGNSLGLIYIQ
jgi:hypothetical protein